ncbi:tetratricopeptide repeat-containing sulfotransferase family protein [Alteromonas sp. D210916BOD_24]|uniref:tetratricopeptide repeat-containing sulfotransferase family protein n=1 Tax=Alteromonas sp. D210916BOD_24 TaxID=3157618 RepID=UPI00399CEA00
MNPITSRLDDAAKFLSQRDYKRAHACCVEVIAQDGSQPHAYFLLGIIHVEIGQVEKAIALFNKSNDLEPRPITYAYLAKCYALKGDMQLALACVEHAPVEALSRALDLDTVGVSLSRVGLHQQAAVYFEKSLSLAPTNPQFNYNFAVSAKFAGNFDIARKHFERAIHYAPDFYQAHFALSDLGEISEQSNHLQTLHSLAARVETNTDARLHIGHALAKEYEALKDYDNAFKALLHAKHPQRQRSVDALHAFESLFSCLHNNLNSQSQTSLEDSNAPIFVVGMPRSGTTLVERILSHHSRVASGGELQDFGVAVKQIVQTDSQLVLDTPTILKAYSSDLTAIGNRYIERTRFLRGNTPHLVDKLPFNFFYIDLIRRALPNAKIICLKRNPMDTCIGNFRQLFSIHSPYYAYAYDLDVIGKFYLQFNQWIDAFASHFPGSIRVQSYEALANEPEREVKALLDFCDLPWEAQCLQVENNDLPVSTASKVQVREPINTRSIGRWQRYQKHTQPLQALLGEASV